MQQQQTKPKTSADFIELAVMPAATEADHEKRQRWWQATARSFRARGATFIRASYDEADPESIACEGWRVEPEDAGPSPWAKT